MSNYYCSKCGSPAVEDSRIGSTDVYLACSCDKRGVWINDGREGYWSSNAKPIAAGFKFMILCGVMDYVSLNL
jgi:hypothetical protein